MADETKPFNAFDAMDLVRAALEPDERKFFKQYLGDESPGLSDWISPQGRFRDARHMRNKIADMVVTEAFKQSQAPTVGDAQTLFPNHKELIPEQAYKAIPQSPLQADEMPVMTGIRQETIPDTRFQGPMPGVMTPLGEAVVKWFGATNESPLNREDNRAFAEKGPEFYQEGPRPTRVRTTGVYGPDTAPSQSIEVDKATKLPPAFQAQLGAMQHQLSTRQPQTHYPSAEEQKLQLGLDLGMKAWQEKNPGKAITAGELNDIYTQVTGLYDKAPRPGSLNERKETAQVIQEEAKANVAKERQKAELGDITARTNENIAKTKDSDLWRQAKLEEIIGRTGLHRAQGNIAAAKAELAAFAEQLRLDERTWKIFSGIMLTGDLDDDSKRAVLKPLLERSGELTVNPNPPGMMDTLLGREHGSGMSITPAPGVTPYKWTNPSGLSGGGIPPQAPMGMPSAPTEPTAFPSREAEMEYHTNQIRQQSAKLRPGETITYKGQKYRKNKDGRMEKVK